MAKSSEQQKYETVYILKPEIPEKTANAIHSKVEEVIKKFKGKLSVRDDWGKMQMAYAIEGTSTGHYVVANYTGDSGVVEEIERHFKISADVIRFMTIKVDDEYNYSNIRKEMKNHEEEIRKNKEQRRRSEATR